MPDGTEIGRHTGQLVRLGELERRSITIYLDGHPLSGMEGDTLLTLLLTRRGHLRLSEFGDGARAGFCNMAACQDCWVNRARACSTYARDGMKLVSRDPRWPK
jgi:hypothetical protein